MTADRKNLPDGELRELLNLGDPAGDGNEPGTKEITAMRRTVLNAIDTSPTARSWLSRPYAAVAATVVVALIALALLLRAGPWGAVLQPETGSVTPAEPLPATLIESATVVAESPEAQAAEPSADPAPVTESPMAAVDPVPIAAVEEPSDIIPPSAEREPLTVRFTAPGGTRIIWTLDPDFQLPVSEPDDRARGEL